MSKGLLQEADIRKMMKFAKLGSLTDGFVDRLSEAGYYGRDDEEKMEEEVAIEEEAPIEEVAIEEEAPIEEEAVEEGAHDAEEDAAIDPEPELDAVADEPELDDPTPEAEGSEAEFGDLIQGIVDQITSWAEGAGVEVPEASVDADDDATEPEMDAMAADEPPMAEAEVEEALEAAGVELEEQELDEDAMINEVTRRVAARLLAATKKSD